MGRLENERTQPTLQTALQACRGLEVSLADLLDGWLGTHAALQASTPALQSAAILTPADVEAFIRSFRAKPLLCSTWLTDSMNGLLAVEGKKLPLFAPVDVVKLLFSDDSRLYHFEILYPDEVAPEALLALCRSGGMITFRDCGHYLERVRRAQGRPQARLASVLGIAPTILSRVESGEQEHVKLYYVLTLDESLEQGGGRLMMLYWNAGVARIDIDRHLSERGEAPLSVYEERLAEVLVSVCRWASLKDPGYAQRLQALRLLDQLPEPAKSRAFPSAWLRARLNYQLPPPPQAQETDENQAAVQPEGREGRPPEAATEPQAAQSAADALRERNREFGRILQEARLLKGMSLLACAGLIGTSSERYAALEAGESPIGAAELEVLVRYLEIPPRKVWPGESQP